MATKKILPVIPTDIGPATKRTAMTNTITFSSDMETLFVIDDGKACAYNLSHPNGVIIGTLRGQVVAGTAEALPPDGDVLQRITLNLQKAQWTAYYRRPLQTLNVIGATDIDLGLSDEKDSKAMVHRFPIGGNPVHIKRSGNTITLALIKA